MQLTCLGSKKGPWEDKDAAGGEIPFRKQKMLLWESLLPLSLRNSKRCSVSVPLAYYQPEFQNDVCGVLVLVAVVSSCRNCMPSCF